VNLEPCAHHGKTPPCADLIISSGIKNVVVANKDPNPLVAGKGLSLLRHAGISVLEGVLESEGQFLNRRFFTFYSENRPYIILKWAETSDGFIARSNYDSKWISNQSSRKLVHQFRAQEDAIMVGKNTAFYDNPQLTVRHWEGEHPIRVVLDTKVSLEADLHLFDGSVTTLCYNHLKSEKRTNLEFIQGPETEFLEFVFNDLHKRNIQSILIEGGAQLLTNLLELGLWDEARIFISQNKFEQGLKAPTPPTVLASERNIDGDLLRTYYHAPH
jgi:diaminohydroxyphosphoribosylaminopyrimidine deaminase/5-amino-6-(5-phosphoribosylamino)uracil reductase